MLSIKALSVQHVSHSHKGKYNLKIWNDIYASQVHDIGEFSALQNPFVFHTAKSFTLLMNFQGIHKTQNVKLHIKIQV